MDNKRDYEWIKFTVLFIMIIAIGIKKGFNYPFTFDAVICIILILLDILDIVFKFSDVTYRRIKTV